MLRGTQQLWLWLALIILTLVGYYAITNNVENTPIQDVANNHPDAYMDQAYYQNYDSEGKLHARLSTPRMTHYPDNDSAQFIDPKMILLTKKNILWHISAKSGQSMQGTKKVLLWNNVIIHQPKQANDAETTVKTSQLTVYPELQTADTKQSVKITRPGSITTAVGMRANFKTGVFELLSQSRGQYDPSANK